MQQGRHTLVNLLFVNKSTNLIGETMSTSNFLLPQHKIAFEHEYLREEVLHSPPLWVTIGIISACAYHCKFCAYHSLDARHISKVYNVKFTMPLAEVKRIIDFLNVGKVPRIHICATGEPLLHKDFFPILDYVIATYGHVSFQSNFPLSCVQQQKAIQKIIERQKYISFITTDMMGNSDIKGGENEELYETLAEISKTSIPQLQGNFLLTKQNLQDLELVVRAVHKHKLRMTLTAVPVFPHKMNKFTSIENTWQTWDMERAQTLKEIVALARSLNVHLTTPTPNHNSYGTSCNVF